MTSPVNKTQRGVEPADIEISTETRVVEGVRLPWSEHPSRIPSGSAPRSGEVFVEQSTLFELAEVDPWASAFEMGSFLLDYVEGTALEQAGLAVRETRGGYHGTPALKELLTRLWGGV